MKNKGKLALFVLFITLSLTLVACSSGESVYNENLTDNPSMEIIKAYNVDIGNAM